jgi:cysteine desulfurase / selenocysteine lyase
VQTPGWEKIRLQFPTLKNWTYLDIARKAPMWLGAQDAMMNFAKDIYENAGEDAWNGKNVHTTRIVMARLLGCAPEAIAFTKNTTEGLNIVSHALDLQPGENIVLTDMEHMANVWVWERWKEKGVELRFVQNRDGRLPLEAFQEKIDENTRVVGTAWVTYRNGYRVNLPELGKICKAHGALLVVDGVQAAGLLDIPFNQLGADAVAIGGHKNLFGLNGSGVLYMRPDLIEKSKTGLAKPMGYVKSTATEGFEDQHELHRFEGGNANYLGLSVFRQSAAMLESVGIGNIENRVRELTDTFLGMLKKRRIKTQTPTNWDERCHIVNFPVAGDAKVIRAALREKRIVVNVKDGYLRASMGFFNKEEELETLLRAVDDL